jgi:ClpP class serine protease
MGAGQRFPFIAQRLFNVPLMITPHKAEIIVAALAERLGIAQLQGLDGSLRTFADDNVVTGDDGDDGISTARERPKGYEVHKGVAIIQVEGTLVHKLGTLRPWSGMTGYDGIRENLLTALQDGEVEGIAFDIDSPGGECAGCFDLANAIFQARGRKPMWAILTECAYSAAYAIASACDRVIVPQTGGTGSVGIIAMHVDMSNALSKAGLKVTLIQYGSRKADFAETAPLSREALARAQADVDEMGGMFDALVARHRNLKPAQVKAWQAATFMGAKGVAAGLADAVMAPDQAMRDLVRSL